MTVRHAYTYDLVGREHALNGMSLTTTSQQVGSVIGAISAGAVIAFFGVGEQYLVVAGLYLVALLVLLAIRDAGQAAPTRRDPVLQSLLGYVRLVRDNRTLMALMFLASTTEIFGFTHQTVLPAFARDVLGVGAFGLGLMMAFRAGGGLIGPLVLASLGNFRRRGQLMFVVAGMFGLGQMAFSLTSNLYVVVLFLAFINACAFSVDTLYRTLMQDSVPNEQRGRAAGSWVLSIGTAPGGHLGVGAIANTLGAPAALLVNGSVLLLIAVASAVGMPRMRRLE
jgi:predicted MFS family arabinose efflux permease